MGQIVSKEAFSKDIKPALLKEQKTIALCHGVFDLVHPGHVIHFQQAKQMADVLVVSVTAAKYVRKGPNRPYFNDEMRLQFLAAIDCIDYVMLSECYTVDDIVESVKPDIYVKGEEYARENDDLTGKMSEERKLVEKHGGVVRYTNGQVFSSTKLINTGMAGLPEEVVRYMEDFTQRYSLEDIRGYAENAAALKVLVVGDIIIDKYTYCNVQGLMSKDTAYSARLDHTEEYLGGAAAIARHLGSFTDTVTLMSMVGMEESLHQRFTEELSEKMTLKLTYSEVFPTIVKHRYLTRNAKREEYRKVFSITNIPAKTVYGKEEKDRFKKQLSEEIEQYDVVFLCDFGHGLIDETVGDIIQKKAKYLVLNCQTNSSNHGMNLITKYSRADAFSLDQEELKLAFPAYASDEKTAIKKLREHLKGNGWLTRGASGAWGIEGNDINECPAFTLAVKDTVGAGDAFYSVAGLFLAAGASVEAGTFMGNIAGALGANIVGNKEAVEKVNVLKYASTLMNV